MIFSTKSYLILGGLPPSFKAAVDQLGEIEGFRVLLATNLEEMQDFCTRAKNFVGINMSSSASAEWMAYGKAQAAEKKIPFKVVDSNADVVGFLKASLEGIEDLLPKNIYVTMFKCLETIGGVLFPGSPLQWKGIRGMPPVGLKHDDLIYCDDVAEDMSAKLFARISHQGLQAASPTLQQFDEAKIRDAIREFLNQTLGLFNQALRAQGLNPKISVPVCVPLSDGAKVNISLFMPRLRFVAAGGALLIEFRLLAEGAVAAQLPKLVYVAPATDIEIL